AREVRAVRPRPRSARTSPETPPGTPGVLASRPGLRRPDRRPRHSPPFPASVVPLRQRVVGPQVGDHRPPQLPGDGPVVPLRQPVQRLGQVVGQPHQPLALVPVRAAAPALVRTHVGRLVRRSVVLLASHAGHCAFRTPRVQSHSTLVSEWKHSDIMVTNYEWWYPPETYWMVEAPTHPDLARSPGETCTSTAARTPATGSTPGGESGFLGRW